MIADCSRSIGSRTSARSVATGKGLVILSTIFAPEAAWELHGRWSAWNGVIAAPDVFIEDSMVDCVP